MKPRIDKLGTLDCDLVETNPVLFANRLYRFDYVRPGYGPNDTGDSYFRFVDWETQEPTADECTYAKDRYTAPHCLRYANGWYYNFYLEAHEGYEQRVVRSRDLIHWEASPLNPVLRASDDDRRIANDALSAADRQRIAVGENLNNSDIDFCQWQGQLWLTYAWGNQRGVEFLAAARYDGTEIEFLEGWFPDTRQRETPVSPLVGRRLMI